jgi:peptidoglycan/LPS O-acetylase OafA/YrhL
VKYRGLDSFRLFAFLIVFLFHVNLLPIGYLGVQAFFVLSGFLITPILIDMRGRLPRGRYFLHFYGRRSLRIFPLYYSYLAAVGACAALALSLGYQSVSLERFVAQFPFALTYTYDFFHASWAFSHSFLLTHFWSLAVEEQFYLVWPLLIFFVANQQLKRVLLAILIAGPALRLAAAAMATSPVGELFYDQLDLVIYVLPTSHIDAFAMGGYLALYGRTPSRAFVGVYAALIVLVGISTERLATGSNGMALGYAPFMADGWKYIWGYTCFNLLFGCILLLIRDRALAPRLVEHPALNYLGKISYGLYVYHFGVIWVLSGMDMPRFYQLPIKDRYFPVAAPSPAIPQVFQVS